MDNGQRRLDGWGRFGRARREPTPPTSLRSAPSLPAGEASRRTVPGAIALGAIGLLVAGAITGLVAEAGSDWSGAVDAFDVYLLRVARFTLWQAVLSTVLSVIPGIFVARALARQAVFPGRAVIVWLFGVPLALPAIVVALGVLALLGRAGYFAEILTAISGSRWPGIYGLGGILFAHVFFNMPLAARLFLEALGSVPADHRRLEAQLGMNAWAAFRLIEWPVIRAALPGVAILIFMLCVTSFTIVLILGGGPGSTTLEVAIYQALRFDFDPGRAVMLTLFQLGLTIVVVAIAARLGAGLAGETFFSVSSARAAATTRLEKCANGLIIALAFLLVAGPIAAVVAAGLDADIARLASEQSVRSAAFSSLRFAFAAACLSVVLSLALVSARRALELKRRGLRPSLFERATDQGAALVLVIPPIVIGAGWFVLLRHSGGVFNAAVFMVVSVNAVMAMPFAIRAIRPAHDAASARHERLCAQLGISGWARLRLIDWPPLRRPMATAFAFAMALSLCDLGVIALFGSESVQTLPYLLLQRMGSYRTQDAAGLALMLGALCFGLMMVADWLSRRRT